MTPSGDKATRALRGEASASARGFFVTIEGIEGAGKSTLAEALAARLREAGREVVLTREPGGTSVGDAIRKILLESGEFMSDRAELLLFEASRAQHVDGVIAPAIQRGAVVICDRFTDSSIAYQGGARKIDSDTVASLNEFAVRGVTPDMTILLDLPAEVGLARQKGVDRISAEGLAFHESVRQGYLAIARAEPGRVVVLDAAESPDVVVERAWEAIALRYGPSSLLRQAQDAQDGPTQG